MELLSDEPVHFSLTELRSSLLFPLPPVSDESEVGSDVSKGEESSLPKMWFQTNNLMFYYM